MIEILTADTPNGVKIPIAAEELGVDYRITPVDLAHGEQRSPAFLAINPNGRIPAIVDHAPPGGRRPVTIFESGAILLYLADTYGGLIPRDAEGRVRALEYLFLQVAGLGPSFGQAGHFLRAAPERLPYAIERFQGEARRHLEVLDRRLAEVEWLAGREFSVADIAHFGWVRRASYAGLDTAAVPNLARWLAAAAARPAVQRGLAAVQGH